MFPILSCTYQQQQQQQQQQQRQWYIVVVVVVVVVAAVVASLGNFGEICQFLDKSNNFRKLCRGPQRPLGYPGGPHSKIFDFLDSSIFQLFSRFVLDFKPPKCQKSQDFPRTRPDPNPKTCKKKRQGGPKGRPHAVFFFFLVLRFFVQSFCFFFLDLSFNFP